jgi:hypothetical protein
MKNHFEENEKENFESMNSTVTPIGRADSRTRRFQEVEELKSKIGEIKGFRKSKNQSRRLKKLKFEEVEV